MIRFLLNVATLLAIMGALCGLSVVAGVALESA